MQFQLWYSREEAAKMLSLSVRAIDRLIRQGKLQTVLHGRRRLILGDSLTHFAFDGSQGSKADEEGEPR